MRLSVLTLGILLAATRVDAAPIAYTFTATVNAQKPTVTIDNSPAPVDVAQALYDYWLPGFDTGTYDVTGTFFYDPFDRAATYASLNLAGYTFVFLDFLAFNTTGTGIALIQSGGDPKPDIPNASAFLTKDSNFSVTNPTGDPAIIPTTLDGFNSGTVRWAGQGWTGPTLPQGPNYGQTYITWIFFEGTITSIQTPEPATWCLVLPFAMLVLRRHLSGSKPL